METFEFEKEIIELDNKISLFLQHYMIYSMIITIDLLILK